MSRNSYEQIMEEIPKRQEHLSKYAPFFSIADSMNSGKYKKYSPTTLILGLVSFMVYEGKLKEKELFFVDLQNYLTTFISKEYKEELTEEQAVIFTRDILDKLGNKGLKFAYPYFNPVKGVEYVENVQYITSVPDRKTGTLKYSLTNTGIDFFLSTKEFGDESKISIYLLLLQKQLKNNNLDEVLNRFVSINAEIKKQIEEKQELMELLTYATKDKFEEYLEYKDRAIVTLRDEAEMFANTRAQILAYERNYLENMTTAEKVKIQEAPVLLEKINRELEKNIKNHASLMKSVLELSEEIPKIRAERMRRMFKSSFNFEHYGNEILKTDDLNNLMYLIEPLLAPKTKKAFNINKIGDMFSYRAKVVNDDKKEINKEEITGDIYTIEDEVNDRINCNYEFYVRELMDLLVVNGNTDIEELIKHLISMYGDEVIINRDFISFINALIPHEKNRKKFKYEILKESDTLARIYKAYLKLIKEKSEFEIFKELEMVCSPTEKEYFEYDGVLKIRNMKFEVK